MADGISLIIVKEEQAYDVTSLLNKLNGWGRKRPHLLGRLM